MSERNLQAQHNFSREPLDTAMAGTQHIGLAVPDDAVEPLMMMCYGMTAHTSHSSVQAMRAADVIEALKEGKRLPPEDRKLVLGSADELNQVQQLIARSGDEVEVFVSHDVPAPARTGGSYAVSLPEDLHESMKQLVETLDTEGNYVTLDAGELVEGFSAGSVWEGTGEHPALIIGTQTDVDSALASIADGGGFIESLSTREVDALAALVTP